MRPSSRDHDVRVGIEREEGRELLHPVVQPAAHEQAAVRIHVVAERQLRQIAAIERNQRTAQPAAEPDASRALIGGQIVGIALRIIEFLLASLDVDIGIGELAEIDLRTRHGQSGNRALHRHVAENQRRQSFGCEAVHRIHGDAVAVGVDQLLVDPIAAALRQFLDVELARREHHLAHRAADLVSIDVDVRKIVICADFLDLTQRILQRRPVPQPYVLERCGILGGLRGFDPGVGGKRVGLDAVERVSLPGHLDVMDDEGTLSHQLVRCNDESADVPAHGRDDEIARNGGNRRRQQPARARRAHRGRNGNESAGDERDAHDQSAAQIDVRVRVGDAREDRAVLEQKLEPAEICAHRKHQEKRGERERETAPEPPLRRGRSPLGQDTGAAGDRDECCGDQASDDRQAQQPPGDELPCRQREQVKVERSPENGVGRGRGARGIPEERQGQPARRHARADDGGDDQRQPESDQLEHRLDRQSDRPPVDEDRGPDQLTLRSGFLQPEHTVDDDEGDKRKRGEGRRLQIEARPEYRCKPQGFEPESIDVIRGGGARAQERRAQDHEQRETRVAAAIAGFRYQLASSICLFNHIAPVPRGSWRRGWDRRIPHAPCEAARRTCILRSAASFVAF